MTQAYGGDKDRIIEIVLTADESDDSLLCTALNYYRDRQHLVDTLPYPLAFTAGAAAGTHEIRLNEILPPPSILRLKSTFQA